MSRQLTALFVPVRHKVRVMLAYTSFGNSAALVPRLKKAERLGLIKLSPQNDMVLWMQGTGQCQIPVDVVAYMQSGQRGADPHIGRLLNIAQQMQQAKDALVCPRCTGAESRLLSFPNDPYASYACEHCTQVYHQCPVHGNNVMGANPFSIDSAGNAVGPNNVSCTCPRVAPVKWHPHANLARDFAARHKAIGGDYIEPAFR